MSMMLTTLFWKMPFCYWELLSTFPLSFFFRHFSIFFVIFSVKIKKRMEMWTTTKKVSCEHNAHISVFLHQKFVTEKWFSTFPFSFIFRCRKIAKKKERGNVENHTSYWDFKLNTWCTLVLAELLMTIIHLKKLKL